MHTQSPHAHSLLRPLIEIQEADCLELAVGSPRHVLRLKLPQNGNMRRLSSAELLYQNVPSLTTKYFIPSQAPTLLPFSLTDCQLITCRPTLLTTTHRPHLLLTSRSRRTLPFLPLCHHPDAVHLRTPVTGSSHDRLRARLRWLRAGRRDGHVDGCSAVVRTERAKRSSGCFNQGCFGGPDEGGRNGVVRLADGG